MTMRIRSLCLLLLVALVGSAMGNNSFYVQTALNTSPIAYWDFQDGSTTDLVNTPGAEVTLYTTVSGYKTATNVPSIGSAVGSPYVGFPSDNEGIEKVGCYGPAAYFANESLTTSSYTLNFWLNGSDDWTTSKLNYLWTVVEDSTFVEGLFIGGNLTQYGATGELVYNGSGLALSGVTLDLDTWYNITLVREATTASIYLDGQLVIDSAAAPALDGNAFYLGGRELMDGSKISDRLLSASGIYDEVVVWNRALTSNEVSTLHSAAITVPEPSILAMLLALTGAFLFRRRR